MNKLNKWLRKKSTVLTISMLSIVIISTTIIFTSLPIYTKAILSIGLILAIIELVKLTINNKK